MGFHAPASYANESFPKGKYIWLGRIQLFAKSAFVFSIQKFWELLGGFFLCFVVSPPPSLFGIDGEHCWAGIAEAFVKSQKRKRKKGIFTNGIRMMQQSFGCLPGKTDASCIQWLADETAHWQLPDMLIQQTYSLSIIAANRALFILPLLWFLPGKFS